MRTAERGVEYWLYITFDKGDRWWDNEGRLQTLRSAVENDVVAKLRQKGVNCRFVFLRYTNFMRKPGPAFNFMMGSAYKDGADYLYRINDDTEFKDQWAKIAIKALKKRNPQNIGVVGPICKQGSASILNLQAASFSTCALAFLAFVLSCLTLHCLNSPVPTLSYLVLRYIEGNQNILTHDMVHRQHLEIFSMYYPPVFTDWWCVLL